MISLLNGLLIQIQMDQERDQERGQEPAQHRPAYVTVTASGDACELRVRASLYIVRTFVCIVADWDVLAGVQGMHRWRRGHNVVPGTPPS